MAEEASEESLHKSAAKKMMIKLPKYKKQGGFWMMNVQGGLSRNILINKELNSDGAALRTAFDDTEKALWGWNGALDLHHVFANGLSLGTGASFERSWTKLNWEGEENVAVLKEDVLIKSGSRHRNQ